MPIRFRCAYCNQLMGIARRKAGTVVRCPKCAGQVVVPFPEGDDLADSEHPQAVADNPQGGEAPGKLFEQNDFANVLEEDHAAGRQALRQPQASDGDNPFAALPGAAHPAYEAVRMGSEKRRPRGIFLTSGALAIVSAIVLVLVGMAFFLGLLLGRSSP
jgi:hypothetical protein